MTPKTVALPCPHGFPGARGAGEGGRSGRGWRGWRSWGGKGSWVYRNGTEPRVGVKAFVWYVRDIAHRSGCRGGQRARSREALADIRDVEGAAGGPGRSSRPVTPPLREVAATPRPAKTPGGSPVAPNAVNLCPRLESIPAPSPPSGAPRLACRSPRAHSARRRGLRSPGANDQRPVRGFQKRKAHGVGRHGSVWGVEALQVLACGVRSSLVFAASAGSLVLLWRLTGMGQGHHGCRKWGEAR